MIPSDVPLVNADERDPLVLQVRRALNIRGDDLLDLPLQQMLRGFQRKSKLEVHGSIDAATLAALGI